MLLWQHVYGSLDAVQIIIWSLTYVLIIIAGFQSRASKLPSMPYSAVVGNFSWELCALIHSRGLWGHILWSVLDFPIFCFCLRSLRTKKQKALMVFSLLAALLCLSFIFRLSDGMLSSCFLIDLIMAAAFLFSVDRLSPKLQIPIAISKLLGDAAAGIYYGVSTSSIATIAVAVFLCNCSYLLLCSSRKKTMKNAKAKQKNKRK